MNKEIEIPFGAKDSELKGWEYTIPEDMEAEIKDGKIIVREKESEDEKIRKQLIGFFYGRYALCNINTKDAIAYLERQKEQQPAEWSEEDEKMEIKFAGKIYKVYGKKDMPGGAIGYIIEDEPGHYDCITNPKEVLGGSYGIKSNGSPYPTKESNFGQPHWKPSEEQIGALNYAYCELFKRGDVGHNILGPLQSLIDTLRKL